MRERNAHVPADCPSAAGGPQRPACGQEAHVDIKCTTNGAVGLSTRVEADKWDDLLRCGINTNIPGRGN